MTTTTDILTQELRRLDPVGPGRLEGVLDTPEATGLLERILSLELEPAARPLQGDRRPLRGSAAPRSRRLVGLLLAVLALAAVAALLIGSPDGGDGAGRGADPLQVAAVAAGSRSAAAAAAPFTYLKTREVAVTSAGAGQRSWSVYEPTTREEWVARDGSGRLRVTTGPARFVGSADRAAWEAAGRPSFLALGFGRRTEDRWLAGGLSTGAAELPADPGPLATRLRYLAETRPGTRSVPAAMLQLIAENLRDPSATPALRQALYEVTGRVPGIEYLGREVDPEGRSGVAVGVTGPGAGGRERYSLIFDPETSAVLATETTELAPGSGEGAAAPRLVRARAYLQSRGIASKKEFAKTWLGGDEPSAGSAESLAAFLVYRIPSEGGSR